MSANGLFRAGSRGQEHRVKAALETVWKVSGEFMSPQTGDGPDTTDYANEATERELREDTFMDGLPLPL